MNRSCNAHINRSRHRDRGAALTEYAIAAAILVTVFIVAGKVLLDSSASRGNAAVGTATSVVPSCNAPQGGLTGDECL